jgi:hypothetical protein
MGDSAHPTPHWGPLGELYDELARVERRHPGSDQARDIEDAITLIIEGRTSSTDARHHRYDAVRRARFLRQQATRKRAAVLSRHASRLPVPRARQVNQDASTDPVGPITPEDIVCARAFVSELAYPGEGAARHSRGVLHGLLADQPAPIIAANLGISRSTVDRCIAHLRARARVVIGEAAAA